MKVKEEVDALVAMGFDPLRFLAVPKVIATVVVMPLLTLYSMLFCIIGGFLVGVYLLDFTVYTYINETMKNITLFDLVSSLIKSVVFAVVVASIGCQRGFQVRGGAEAVGTMTTSAVVTSLFLIVIYRMHLRHSSALFKVIKCRDLQASDLDEDLVPFH